jgi:hypothetical protein
MGLDPVTAIVGLGAKLIDELWTSDEERAAAKLQLLKLQQDGELKELIAASGIITAEANSEHKLTSQWRPITMLTFVIIIANNYIVYPYLSLFWPDAPRLELPPDMWDLLKIGLGGYVLGRSGEKTVKLWRSKEGAD